MKDIFCESCMHHKVFWDVLGNTIFNDGCICNLNTAETRELHGDNCTEYVEPSERKGCPYHKIKLEE